MKVCSIFSQVLKLFSRGEFEKAVKEHKAERHARGFASWAGRIRCARSVVDWRAARGSGSIWGCRWHPRSPRWPTPMNIDRGNFTRPCLSRSRLKEQKCGETTE